MDLWWVSQRTAIGRMLDTNVTVQMDCNRSINGTHSSINPRQRPWQCKCVPVCILSSQSTHVIRLNAIQNIGQLVALPFCAIACDSFGRRPVLLLGAFFIMIGVVLQGAAQNSMSRFWRVQLFRHVWPKVLAGMFIAARGIIGFGLAFNITAAPLLIMELAFPTQKVCQYLGSGFPRTDLPGSTC